MEETIFDANWLRAAQTNVDQSSWVEEVIETFDSSGKLYLDILQNLFNGFPLNSKQKWQLKTRIESFNSADHLGAVNELAWWAFLEREQFNASPIPVTRMPTPDFHVIAPSDFFVEVSTLNISKSDQSKFELEDSVELDHSETLRRILGKLTDEKRKQLSYAAKLNSPSVLVLFDYTTWSQFPTQFYRFFAEFLLGRQRGFQSLPIELSALVYVERKVLVDGHLAICLLHSATYYNPYAQYPLPFGSFSSLNQYGGQMVPRESISNGLWVRACRLHRLT